MKECDACQGPVQYPGLPIPQAAFNGLDPATQRLVAKWNKHYDRSVMAADLLWPLALSARHNLPLYCGEFGVIHHTPEPLREAWHSDFIGVLEEHGIAWANGSYKGGFGMLDASGDPPAWLARVMSVPG